MGNLFSSSTKSTSTSNSNSKSSSTSNSNSKSTSTSNSNSKSTSTSNGSNDGLNDSSSDDSSSDSLIDHNSKVISWYMKIKDKLKDEEIYNSLGKKKLNELIFSLGDETKFLDQHLKLFYDDDHLNKINRDLRRLDRLQGNNFIPSEEDGRDLVNGLLQRRREADKFNVYLFIEKLSDNRSDSSFLRFLANYVFKNKYGMFHVGLEIDGIVLEWGTGDAGPHLIYPQIKYMRRLHIFVNLKSFWIELFSMRMIDSYSKGESSFQRQDLDQFADQNWNMITNSWDKRLLLCYSDMMNNMYEYKYDEKWGPMNNKEKWIEREYELRTD
ncbi:unnamed protein product [Rhizophagus irregularis]|nr:unnamed protein product [Rhizophagus irregularis]